MTDICQQVGKLPVKGLCALGVLQFEFLYAFYRQSKVVRECLTQKLQGCQCLKPAIKPQPCVRNCCTVII